VPRNPKSKLKVTLC